MQNNKRYWLRGGVIFTIIYVVVAVLYIPPFIIKSDLAIFPLEFTDMIGKYSGFYLCTYGYMLTGLTGLVIGMLVLLAIYVTIGVLLGQRFSKVKNRNKTI